MKQANRAANSCMIITGRGIKFTHVLDGSMYTIQYRTSRRLSLHFPREHAVVGKPAKKLIETYLRQRRILKQSEEEEAGNKDTSVRTRNYSWGGRCTKDEFGRGSKIPAKTGTRKTVYIASSGERKRKIKRINLPGPIARLNLIIQAHAISSSSASRSTPLMFNHSRNHVFLKEELNRNGA